MAVRCKFKCIEVSKRVGWGENKVLYAATMTPVTCDSEENKKFFAATPAGKFEVSTVVVDLFEIGKEYYIDISPA